MTQLGLEKKAKQLLSLTEYLSSGKAVSAAATTTKRTKSVNEAAMPDAASIQEGSEP
jgi:hypothetical protein